MSNLTETIWTRNTSETDYDVIKYNHMSAQTHWRIQRGGCGGCNPPLNFQKREVTSVAVVISTVSTVSEQERNGTGRTGVTLGSQSTSVRPLCSQTLRGTCLRRPLGTRRPPRLFENLESYCIKLASLITRYSVLIYCAKENNCKISSRKDLPTER